MKRALSAVLVLTLAFVLFSGCTKTDGTVKTDSTAQQSTGSGQNAAAVEEDYGDTGGLKLPLADEVVTITAFAQSDASSLSDKWVFDELEKRTNIRVKITPIPPNGYNDKVKVIVASGNMTDIAPVGEMGIPTINSTGMKGAIAAINKYSDMLPNFRKFIEKYPWVMKSYAAADGNLYFWPLHERSREVNHGYLYRKDIFDKNGIKPWSNTDEFYAALKKLKEIYPNSYPWANKNKEQIFMLIGPNWGFQWQTWPIYYDYASNTWKAVATDANFKDMLQFLQKLYKEKLLDPEFLTDTDAAWTQKMTTGTSFVTFDWIGRMEMFYNQVKDTNPDYDLRYANPIGPAGLNTYLAKVLNTGICVTNNDKKEYVLKLLDYFTSPSGTELMTMGGEGVTYTKASDGKISYVGFDEGTVPGIKDLEDKYGLFIQPTMYTRMDPRSVYFNYSAREKEAQDMMVQNNKIQKPQPILAFNEDEQDTISKYNAEISKAMDEFAAKFVLEASKGDAQWNEWVKKIGGMGVQKLVDAYNSAQKRYDASK